MDLPRTDAVHLSDEMMQQAIADLHAMAESSGRVILKHFRSALDIDNKAAEGEFDPVTVADRGAESAIREVISQRRPLDGILGEEHGYKAGTSGLIWIIDPIDGTRAFIAGLPVWGTLVALYDGQKSILGMMDQPYLQERYLGCRLGAQFFRQKAAPVPLSVKPRASLDVALLASTAPEVFSDTEMRMFQRVAKEVATVRYGTDCYGYAMLAAGSIDLVIEAGLQAYDIHPLIPIIEAAGGIVTDWQGRAVSDGGYVLAAASAELHEAALEQLNQSS